MYSWSRERRVAASRALAAAMSIYGYDLNPQLRTISHGANSIRFHVAAPYSGQCDLLVKVIRSRLGASRTAPTIDSLTSVSMLLQNAFRNQSPAWLRIPEALYCEDSIGLLVMEYVDGINLKRIL